MSCLPCGYGVDASAGRAVEIAVEIEAIPKARSRSDESSDPGDPESPGMRVVRRERVGGVGEWWGGLECSDWKSWWMGIGCGMMCRRLRPRAHHQGARPSPGAPIYSLPAPAYLHIAILRPRTAYPPPHPTCNDVIASFEAGRVPHRLAPVDPTKRHVALVAAHLHLVCRMESGVRRGMGSGVGWGAVPTYFRPHA